MSQIFQIIRTTSLRITTGLFAFILVSLVAPVFLLLFLPSCLVRWIVSNTAKRYKPNLGKMLTSGSALHAQDDLTGIILAPFIVEGSPNLENVWKEMQSKVLELKWPSTDTLKYPELQQNITSWMGFQFWSPVENFRLEDHIYYHDHKITKTIGDFEMEGQDGDLLFKYLMRKPWPKSKALWEAILIPTVTTRSSSPEDNLGAIIYRFHHSLSDAFSGLLLLDNLNTPRVMDSIAKSSNLKNLNKAGLRESKLKKVINATVLMLKMVYGFADALLSLKSRSDPLRSRGVKVNNDFTSSTSELQHNSEIKSIAVKHGVSFSAVLIASIAKGIRETMIKRFGKVDQDISLHFPMPLPNHPEKLRNHAALGFMTLPLVEQNPIKRLKLIHKEFERAKKSPFPRVMFMVSTILGCQFSFVLKCFLQGAKTQSAVVLTNIANSPIPFKFYGYPLKLAYAAIGVGGTKVLMFGYISMAGSGKFILNSDTSLLATREDADNLLTECIKELEILDEINFDNKGFEMV